MAARIAAQAKGGEILVSAVVKDLCEGTDEVEQAHDAPMRR
jgi:class 3 adenylate cyclase